MSFDVIVSSFQREITNTLTILAVEDGSATRAMMEVNRGSYDVTRDAAGEAEHKKACPFAGAAVILTRHPDSSITDDLPKEMDGEESSMVDSFIIPDQNLYPDKTVAVGDTWDNSAKIAKERGADPKDKVASVCRLDWVKNIDGKQTAQISTSEATVLEVGGNMKLEEDSENTRVNLVDIATGTIVKSDVSGKSKYISPPTEAIQTTGGTEMVYHCEVLSGEMRPTKQLNAPTSK